MENNSGLLPLNCTNFLLNCGLSHKLDSVEKSYKINKTLDQTVNVWTVCDSNQKFGQANCHSASA